jgi:sec-independent protein translocase protein TatA
MEVFKMLSNIGPGMLVLIIIAALLLFGPSKLPELGRAFGKTLREFKNGAKEVLSDDEPAERKEVGSSERQATEHKSPEETKRLPD